MLTPIIFIGVLSSIASDAGYRAKFQARPFKLV
jgi:hypothetical protein